MGMVSFLEGLREKLGIQDGSVGEEGGVLTFFIRTRGQASQMGVEFCRKGVMRARGEVGGCTSSLWLSLNVRNIHTSLEVKNRRETGRRINYSLEAANHVQPLLGHRGHILSRLKITPPCRPRKVFYLFFYTVDPTEKRSTTTAKLSMSPIARPSVLPEGLHGRVKLLQGWGQRSCNNCGMG